MCRKMVYILAVACIFAGAGCSDDKTQEDTVLSAVVSGTDIPWDISWQGGEYTLKVDYKPVTRSEIEGWSYRLMIDGEQVESKEILDGANEVAVAIPINYLEKERNIAVEVKIPKGNANPQWTTAATAKQGTVMVEVGGIYWALTNLAAKGGKYVMTDTPEQGGFYFKHMSTYGVPSDGEQYAGKAYNPTEVSISLNDIPERDGDPCSQMSNGKLRLPTRGELGMLFYFMDIESGILNNTEGLYFGSGKRLFLPFAGSCDMETGVIGFKNRYGGYWCSGDDGDGHGYILTVNSQDLSESDIFPSYGTGMGSVRCVRNLLKAAYLSHTPEKVETNDAFVVKVETTPGASHFYPVELRDMENNRGPYVNSVYVVEGNSVEITVPKNDDPIDVVYELYIDDQPTGKNVLQGRKRNYAEYRSHAPKGPVPGDAFTLKVTCESDMDSFDVEVKTGTTSLVKNTGSKTNPVVELFVPENTGAERQLEIWVNGVAAREKITQEKKKVALSVIWSTGYLTVKDGAYNFAGEQEQGMFFKFKSRYGMLLSSNNYTGTAYAPEAVQKPFVELTYNEIDPCSLVADGKSWRMPTYAEWDQLFQLDFMFSANKYRMYYDESQNVYLTPSGQLKDTGIGVMLATAIRIWSSSPGVKDPAKISTVALTLSSNTSKPTNTEVAGNLGMMVRCVREKN